MSLIGVSLRSRTNRYPLLHIHEPVISVVSEGYADVGCFLPLIRIEYLTRQLYRREFSAGYLYEHVVCSCSVTSYKSLDYMTVVDCTLIPFNLFSTF